MKIIKLFIFALTLVISVSGCSTNPEVTGDAPVLPSTQSMNINFDELDVQAKARPEISEADSNFAIALVSAGIIKQFYEASLELPKSILEAAQDVEPEFIGDATWQWTYASTSENGIPFSVRLTGTLEPQWITWNFYVSVAFQQTNWDDVLLFSGTTSYDGTEGTWSVFNPVTEAEIYDMEWLVLEESTAIIMNINPQEDGNSDYEIVYTFEDSYKTVILTNNEDESQTVIKWNVETGAGFIVSPNYNGGIQSCWDENYQNTACS